MCARYTLTAEEKELLHESNYKLFGEYNPDSNVAITDFGFVVTSDQPTLVQKMHFGIVPHDAKTKTIGFDTWNIRSEEVVAKKTFEPLMRHRKTCLVIMDGFYEWQEEADGDKQPWKFIVPGRKTFCCAGLWSRWVDPLTGEIYDSFGIMTCKANHTVGEIHKKKRMPVILHKSDENTWLSKKLSIDELLSLCAPFPDNKMQRYIVSKKMNKVSTKKAPNKGLGLSLPLNNDKQRKQPDLFS
ncbi:putative SOS response-associated peptidase YedK [Pedobacter sp. CG_S7]|uniref:SOS response-associated peptidase n=1 Tax=Pedobacter sp. CG_S7 TaxID=3143930 RepID=UPI0033960FCF